MERISHNNVPVDNLYPYEVLERVKTLWGESSDSHHLVTLTIGMYLAARGDDDFRKVLKQASMVVSESSGLLIYSLLSRPKLVKTPGGDLARSLVDLCAELGYRVVLFGSSQENRSKAAETLRAEAPNLDLHLIDGEYNFYSSVDSQYVVSQLDRKHPRFAIMAGDEVAAEKWINSWVLGSGVKAGIIGNFGQTLDVWAGKRYVPPKMMRDHNLGWIFRLIGESPQRRKHYLKVLGDFGVMALSDLLRSNVNNPEIATDGNYR